LTCLILSTVGTTRCRNNNKTVYTVQRVASTRRWGNALGQPLYRVNRPLRTDGKEASLDLFLNPLGIDEPGEETADLRYVSYSHVEFAFVFEGFGDDGIDKNQLPQLDRHLYSGATVVVGVYFTRNYLHLDSNSNATRNKSLCVQYNKIPSGQFQNTGG
jgi:hypothetical protein